MTVEQVEKGKELITEIEGLKKQKLKWEKAAKIYRLEVKGDCYSSSVEIDGSIINFKELRLLSLAKIDEILKAKQEEFNNL